MRSSFGAPLLITGDGYENLSRFVPIDVREIEKLMSERR